MYITNKTIATIEKTKCGTYKLTMWNNKKPVYTNEYKTFKGANIAQTKRINNMQKTGRWKHENFSC